MRKLFKYLRKFWWQIILLFIGVIILVIANLQLPDRMAIIVNQGIVGGNQNLIWQEGILMIAIALVGGAADVMAGFFAARIGAGLAKNLRTAIFKKVLSFSVAEIDNFSTASLITRTTNDISQIQQSVVMFLRMSLRAVIMAAGATVMALKTAPSMAWIIGLAIGALFAVIAVLVKTALPKFKIMQKFTDKLNQVARENLTGLRVIRAFNNEGSEEKKFEAANKDITKVNLFVNRTMVVLFPVVYLILNMATLLIIWVGAGYVEGGLVELGNVMAFLQYAIQVMTSFMFMAMVFVIVPRAMVSWRRIMEVLDTKNSIKLAKKPKRAVTGKRGVVEFKNVSFKYQGANEPILKDISFETAPGQTIAFIGSTGSGKSTLINLIPRFYDATEGEILIDGVNVKDYRAKDLMEKIGLVPQRGVLFSGTVSSNIMFGAPNANKKQVKKAAEIAQAYNFIQKLDGKFDAKITQGGSNVSGGQKQRLSIARAIAKDPEIYIFDDSFSALDFMTDVNLRKALSEVVKDATVLVVAQRVGTIKQADQIIVLDKGRIVGKGTHLELLISCPVYKEIATSQLSDKEMQREMRKAAR